MVVAAPPGGGLAKKKQLPVVVFVHDGCVFTGDTKTGLLPQVRAPLAELRVTMLCASWPHSTGSSSSPGSPPQPTSAHTAMIANLISFICLPFCPTVEAEPGLHDAKGSSREPGPLRTVLSRRALGRQLSSHVRAPVFDLFQAIIQLVA